MLLRAAAGWTTAETARRFLVSEVTVASWMARVDEHGPDALVRIRGPVNRFPDYVREIVRNLRALMPTMGKVRIAQTLAKAGLHLSATTARRFGRAPANGPSPPVLTTDDVRRPEVRRVRARHAHHTWSVDLTVVPRSGWWVPWIPQSLAPYAPFCAWLVVVLDHFSRSVVASKLFDKLPNADQVCSVLDAARSASGRTPKYVLSDRGVHFRTKYEAWCRQRGVKPRFGAIGEHGSIAVLERFFRSLKAEMLRKLPWVPIRTSDLRKELAAYFAWYDEHRPHQGLGGRTPREVRLGARSGSSVRLETRTHLPLANDAERVDERLALRVERLGGRPHLPIVSLRKAA